MSRRARRGYVLARRVYRHLWSDARADPATAVVWRAVRRDGTLAGRDAVRLRHARRAPRLRARRLRPAGEHHRRRSAQGQALATLVYVIMIKYIITDIFRSKLNFQGACGKH